MPVKVSSFAFQAAPYLLPIPIHGYLNCSNHVNSKEISYSRTKFVLEYIGLKNMLV